MVSGSAPAEDPLLGVTLAGRFHITEKLGEGGMASVYRATQGGEAPDVAVKVLHADLVRERELVKRFEREAKAATKISHANTVRVLEHGVDGGHIYLVMEIVRGTDLRTLLAGLGRMAQARSARLVMEVCSALHAAHELGIVHRDLKPENVMVDPDPETGRDRIKVLDFGIAKILEPTPKAPGGPDPLAQSNLTQVGTVVGTPEYVSPEQVRSEAIDARSDVYACGIVLYELCTGEPPFHGGTALELALRHARETPRAPSSLEPALDPRLEQLILRAIAKSPALRPQSARELAEALAALAPSLPEAAAAPIDEAGAGGAPEAPGEAAPVEIKPSISFAPTVRAFPAASEGARPADDPPEVDDLARTWALPRRSSALPVEATRVPPPAPPATRASPLARAAPPEGWTAAQVVAIGAGLGLLIAAVVIALLAFG